MPPITDKEKRKQKIKRQADRLKEVMCISIPDEDTKYAVIVAGKNK
jgi:hypothetical protein